MVFIRHYTAAILINTIILIRPWRGASNEQDGLRIMNPVVESTKENFFLQYSYIEHTVSIIFECCNAGRRIYSLTTKLNKCWSTLLSKIPTETSFMWLPFSKSVYQFKGKAMVNTIPGLTHGKSTHFKSTKQNKMSFLMIGFAPLFLGPRDCVIQKTT